MSEVHDASRVIDKFLAWTNLAQAKLYVFLHTGPRGIIHSAHHKTLSNTLVTRSVNCGVQNAVNEIDARAFVGVHMQD